MVSGIEYQKTLEAWLRLLDENKQEALELFRRTQAPNPTAQLVKWRMFFLVCAESFGYGKGDEWVVSHYLFRKRGGADSGIDSAAQPHDIKSMGGESRT